MLKFLRSSYQKIKSALSKTRSLLGSKIQALFAKPWDEATFEELERVLYEADLGSLVASEFVQEIRKFLRKKPDATRDEILHTFQAHALSILHEAPPIALKHPHVILIVGVNGSGKTTSIAKLAHLLQKEGKKVLLAAGDTFRAAAIDQLALWAEKLGCEIIKSKPGSDPASVAFDALTAAKARGVDVVLLDTAGRLQNKKELMQELEKIRRTCTKVIPDSPHETLLVLDATTGQNALDQAATFHACTPLAGVLLAKLDGSAKGGIILSIYKQLGIPVRWVGVGEKVEDLLPFDPENYVRALFEDEGRV
jgi:fused signal recognition particle receptor